MKKCSGGSVLLIFSSLILFNAIFMTFGGFAFMMRLGMPIGLRLMPLDQDLMAWLDIPMPVALVGRIKKVTPLPPMDGSVGGGEMEMEFNMKKWQDAEGEETLRLTEAVFVQETAEIDEIQHYKVVLSKVGFSSWNLLCWILICVGVLSMIGGAALKLSMTKAKKKELLTDE